MVAAGNFCLVETFFPGCPGDSFVFYESELAKLKRKGYPIPTYREEEPKSTSSKEGVHKSPHTKQDIQKPSHKAEESCKSSNKVLGTFSPQAPDSMSAS